MAQAKDKPLTHKTILSPIARSIDDMLVKAAAALGTLNDQAAVTIKINVTRQSDGRLNFYPEVEVKGKQYSIGGKAKGKSIIADLDNGELRNIQIGMFDKKSGAFTPDAETTLSPDEQEEVQKAVAEGGEI